MIELIREKQTKSNIELGDKTMTAMELAHRMRKMRINQNKIGHLSYNEQMSLCLKEAHRQINQTKKYREEAKVRFNAQEMARKEQSESLKKVFSELRKERKNRPTSTEKCLAKAAFAADQRDRKAGIMVRGF